MGNLFLSFTIAISGAIGLVVLSSVFNLENYTSKSLPLIPLLYAIVYEVLEHKKKKGTAKTVVQTPRERVTIREREALTPEALTFGRVVSDVGVIFIIKFSLEMFLVALFLIFSGQTFGETYGAFHIDTVGKFLRGDHPWLTGTEGMYLLALIAFVTCIFSGLWIGYTSKGKAIVEGVLAGAAVTVIMAMTNMLTLYRKLEDVTVQFADSLGYAISAGFLVVIALQVLLYGLWSGLVQRGKIKRARLAANEKTKKKPKK
jgi:hypothetical protein